MNPPSSENYQEAFRVFKASVMFYDICKEAYETSSTPIRALIDASPDMSPEKLMEAFESSPDYTEVITKALETVEIKARVRVAFRRICNLDITGDLLPYNSKRKRETRSNSPDKKVKRAAYAVGYTVAANVTMKDQADPAWILVKIKSVDEDGDSYVCVDVDEESVEEWSLTYDEIVDYQRPSGNVLKKDMNIMALYLFVEDDEFSTEFYKAKVLKKEKDHLKVEYEDGEQATILATQAFSMD